MERIYYNRIRVKTLFIVGFSLFTSLLFFSCENFLDSTIKDEILNDIYIANHECPEATIEEPVMTDKGVAKNKAIVISFSIPVDPKTFDENFKIIDSAGYDLREYFLEPQWANGNKLVTIPADELHLINLNGADTLDITISLSKNIRTTVNLPLKSAVSRKYRICNDIDNTAPVIASASYAERPSITYRNAVISDSIKLVEGSITAETEENICKTNHINTTVKLYVEGSDYGGGAVKGHIKYHRIYDPTGAEVNEDEEDIIDNLSKIEDSENSGEFFTIDLSDSQKYQDGMYEIKVSILDSYGKESSNTNVYYVIRDTKLPYCVTSRFVNDTPYFRDDIDTDNYWIKTFNSQVPTINKIESFKKHVIIDKISDDVYYTSKLTKKEYGDKQEDFSYFLSWGLSLDTLTAVPVKLDGEVNHDILVSQAVDSIKIYTVPDDFINFMKNNESKDIIASVTIMDPMGNQNVIYALYPKKIDFYNYVVSDDTDNTGKKKVELNFADIINEKNIPNSSFRTKFRVFYAPLGNLAEDADTSELELKRNWLLPYSQNNNDSECDSTTIKNLAADTKYVVYIQTAFDADSTLNGQWTGTTFGPLERIIVDTGKNAGGNIVKPEFEIIKKESAGINTGLLKITVKVNDDVYNANKALGVKYVPCFKPHSVFDDRLTLLLGEWTSYESSSDQEFTFLIKTPVRAPFGYGESWDSLQWDGPVVQLDQNNNLVTGTPGEGVQVHYDVWGDYTYVQAVKNCLGHGLSYVDSTENNVKGYFKLVAAGDGASIESDELTYVFEERDDNIPPKLQSDIVLHDSRLSYDGHSFEYENIIREDEGHLSEFYQWYYTPYNPAWGDNLSVMTPEEIERLPGGITSYTGSTWQGHNDKDDEGNSTPRGAKFNLNMNIPVFGLPDGDYMYFAKVYDTYGNYTYVTLGKGHIGTFKNKLKVELAENEKHFVSTLELAPDEEHFDRNMISVKRFGPDADEPSNSNWHEQYEWLNELQNCEKKTQNGKTVLYNNNNEAGDNVFILDWKTASPDDDRLTLDTWNFYKITMQSFNENSLEGYWDSNGQAIISKPGVDRIYGRPYHYKYDAAKDEYIDVFGKDVLWWVDGETQYDVCTEETVSNTVYFYVPGKGYDDQGNRHPEWDEDFNDFYASFFASSAIARSNHNFIVNVIASSTDLGNDIDEWERRGKLIKTHYYSPNKPTDSWYNAEFDMNVNPFDYNVASNDVADSHEKGLIYYVAVAHFADNSSAISDVFTMYGF